MKSIELKDKKGFILLNDDDYKNLSKYTWYLIKGGYVIRYFSPRKYLLMHREILNAPKGMEVDHINHNGLDNRRINLRLCTPLQNSHNRRKSKLKLTSKYKGVSWHKQNKAWRVVISNKGKYVDIGTFKNELAAAMAYDIWAKEIHGDFAYLNFPYAA